MIGLPLLLAATLAAPPADPFRFKDGDRVVFLGSTLIEREQKYGHWEFWLRRINPGIDFTVRNLGWSGDTVWGEARNGFDESPKGYGRLVSLATELKPTVLVVCYGHNESFVGPAGVPRFAEGLAKLLDALAPTKARFVLMSPTPFLHVGSLTNSDTRNADLALYRDVIRDAAITRQAGFVDLFNRFHRGATVLIDGVDREPLTDNGLHLNDNGYSTAAWALLAPEAARDWAYVLSISAPFGGDWERRAAIVEKDRLFFHRWRPQNETYLFGFRKHEQGKNSAEVAAFDPLIDAADKKIAELWHVKPKPAK